MTVSTVSELLHNQISAICPIEGICIVDQSDSTTWIVHYSSSATSSQISAAQSVISSFNITNAASTISLMAQLSALDEFLPRAMEDTWVALALDTTKLPQAQQDRLAQKQSLRSQLAALGS